MKTFKKIIVATDFSDNAKSAFHYAQNLAAHFGAAIEVVHIFDMPINPVNPNYTLGLPSVDELADVANHRLARFVNETDDESSDTIVVSRIKTTYKARLGFPVDTLIDMSKDPSVDLLILGAAGEHSFADKLFGSTAVEVSRAAYCPVLLVPHGAIYQGIHHIVYSSSLESADQGEIKLAFAFAKYFASAIHFVHVIMQPDDSGISEKVLFKRLIHNEHTNVVYSVNNIRAFTPAEGIAQYAANNTVDMIVTVTKHRTFWEKLMHLSTTKTLAWHAELPLLVLHHEAS